jgi:hypothetical protein
LDSSLTHYTASIPLLKELTPLFLKRKGFPDRLLVGGLLVAELFPVVWEEVLAVV